MGESVLVLSPPLLIFGLVFFALGIYHMRRSENIADWRESKIQGYPKWLKAIDRYTMYGANSRAARARFQRMNGGFFIFLSLVLFWMGVFGLRPAP
jgi:hypothetical protein